jgi:hypothetical protein
MELKSYWIITNYTMLVLYGQWNTYIQGNFKACLGKKVVNPTTIDSEILDKIEPWTLIFNATKHTIGVT